MRTIALVVGLVSLVSAARAWVFYKPSYVLWGFIALATLPVIFQ